MSNANGHANDEAGDGQARSKEPASSRPHKTWSRHVKKVHDLVDALEVPFNLSAIEWRAVHSTKGNGHLRGQVIPYADQRAYTDRLNALVTPAGWTRRYTVHSTANFHRGKDQKIVAKVLVTCDLTIFDLGSHSATGEEWADDDNAGTSAEAQAFKRACSCFGLGRYLYHFNGIWVDLDDRKRPKTAPKLPEWATPEGWRKGLRPQPQEAGQYGSDATTTGDEPLSQRTQNGPTSEQVELIRQIESMAHPLGRRLYRGLLKTVRAWQPSDITDTSVLCQVLGRMETADQLLNRLSSVVQQTGPEPLQKILRSLQVRSLEYIETVEMLEKIVCALEAGSGRYKLRGNECPS